MNNELWANMYQQEHANINGRGVWHYLIDTQIGQIHVVEYEGRGMEIKTHLILNDNDKAEKLFKKCCKDLLDGKNL